ncbi:MAG: hypothetical protein LBH90_09325 [Tannerella sp.]|nr:hypothetical protein [Tannerella sp.]
MFSPGGERCSHRTVRDVLTERSKMLCPNCQV